MQAIAEYFDVPLSHFYDAPFEGDTTGFSQDLKLIDAISDDAVRRLLCNAHGLSPDSMDILISFEDRLHGLR